VPAAVAPVAAEYVPAPQSAQAFHAALASEVRTPARNELPACTTILMYRATTGWLKLLRVLTVLEYVVGGKNRVVPPTAGAETKFDAVSECCTSIS
jgi:hypothetical protein